MADGNDEGTGFQPPTPPAPPQQPARQPGSGARHPVADDGSTARHPVAEEASTARQPGVRTPQGTPPEHAASVLRHPTITVEPATLRAAPGATSELVVAITNNSDTVSDFTLELDDRSIGWIRIDPPTRNLWTGARDVFRIQVTPPRSAEVRAGLKQYGLTVTSTGIPGGVATTAIQIEVLPFEAIEPRLVPRTSAGYFRGRHRVEVKNLGSAPWTALVTATDPEEALKLSVPPRIAVGPGDIATVRVSVQPKGWNIIGTTQPHPFSVELDPGSGAKLRLEATHNQRPIIPRTLLIPVLAAGALVLAGALWALGVIPPGGGTTETPSPPPSPTVVPSASAPPTTEPTTPPDSPSPSASTETPSEPVTPSASTAVKPDDVDQWAWDRYILLLTQDNSFDVLKPIGGTADTTDGLYRVQWFELAVMYQPKQPDSKGRKPTLVVRPPILATFPLQPISRDRPSTGYPLDKREPYGKSGGAYQPFQDAIILCVTATNCSILANEVFDLWQDHAVELGSPTNDGIYDGSTYTYYDFEHGRILTDGAGTRFACNENGQFIGGSFPVDCTGYMVGP